MEDLDALYRLEAIKSLGPPINAFTQVSRYVNPEGYEINPMLLDLLQIRRFKGDGTEDPYDHIDFFREICETFKFNAFT